MGKSDQQREQYNVLICWEHGADIFSHKTSVACGHHDAAHQSVHVAHQRTRGLPARDCICHICHMLSRRRTALP